MVALLPQHIALLEIIGTEQLTAPEIVTRVRKEAVDVMVGYYAPLAVQVHLDQLLAWQLIAREGDEYSVVVAGGA